MRYLQINGSVEGSGKGVKFNIVVDARCPFQAGSLNGAFALPEGCHEY